MKRNIAFGILSMAIVVGSASTALAGGKGLADPRHDYASHRKGPLNWCDTNPSCNGWDKWLQGVKAGKKYS
jgi:hypothetical protein